MGDQTGRDAAGTSAGRGIAPSVGRVVGSTTVLLVLYAAWPLDERSGVPLVVRFLAAIAGVGVVFAFQLRSIVNSPRPAIRAVEALAASIPILLLTYAATFHVMSTTDAGAFSEPLSKGDALYFATTTFATVGFGDIAPVTEAARLAVSVQVLLNLLVLGVGVRVVIGAVQIGRERGGAPADP